MQPRRDVILVPSDRWIEGRLYNGDEKPLIGVTVSVSQGSAGRSRATTDSEGRFRLENLVGEVVDRLYIRDNALGSYEFRYVPTNLSTGFTLVKGTHFIAGKVIDTDGNPIKGVYVFIHPQRFPGGQLVPGIRTDDDGTFRIANIPEDIEDLSTNHDEYLYKQIKHVELDRNDIVFVLEKKPAAANGDVLSQDFSDDNRPYTVQSITVKAAITIDGELADWESIGAERSPIRGINPDLGGAWLAPPSDEELSAALRCAADDDCFYIAVSVTDDEFRRNTSIFSQSYMDDCIEILFHNDQLEERAAQIMIGLDENGNVRVDGHVPTTEEKCPYLWQALGTKVAVRETGGGYTAECAVPWSVLRQAGWETDRLKGLNVRVYDKDGDGTANYMTEWAVVPGLKYRELILTADVGGSESAFRTPCCEDVFAFFESVNGKDYDAAEKAIDTYKDEIWTLTLQAILLQLREDDMGYNAVMSRILDQAPDLSVKEWAFSVLSGKASNMERSGRYREAAEILGPIIGKCPPSYSLMEGQYILVRCYVNTSRFTDAKRVLTELLRSDPEVMQFPGNARDILTSAEQMLAVVDRLSAAH